MAVAHGAILALGALLVSVPLILHLLMQPRPRRMVFPALRFVQQNQRVNQRQLRLRHWLLLLLRCLVILLLAAALARPSTASNLFGTWITVAASSSVGLIAAAILAAIMFLRRSLNIPLVATLALIVLASFGLAGMSAVQLISDRGGQIIGDQQAPVSAVILVDVSPRMDYRHENQTRLERAKVMGQWVLNQLPPDSQIALVSTEGEPPFYSVDLIAASRRLETLSPQFLVVPLPQMIGESLDLLEQAEHPRRELYVLTDLTRPAWDTQGMTALTNRLENMPEVSIYLIDLGVEQPINSALGDLQLRSHALPLGSPLEISTSVHVTGTDQQHVVRMRLEQPDPTRPVRRDGRTLLPESHWTRARTVQVPAGGASEVQMVIDETLPVGVHHGFIEIEGQDALAFDDRRFFTIEVRAPWRVLVIAPQGVSPANVVETLAPYSERAGGTAAFDITVMRQGQLELDDLGSFQAVYLLDPQPVRETVWSALLRWVQAGGGLGVFLGVNAADAQGQVEAFNTAAAQELLPGLITESWRRPDGQLFLSPDTFTHPVLRPFREIATRVPWNQYPVYRHWGLAIPDELTGTVEVIARYGNGMPALVERSVGRGRVLLMTTPLTEPARPEGRQRWNELFRDDGWPTWLLTRQTGEYLVATTQPTLNVALGQAVSLENDPRLFPTEYWLFPPGDQEPSRVIAGDDNTIRYRFTNQPGSYRFRGTRDGPVSRGFSANAPLHTSDLRRIEVAQLDAILGQGRYTIGREQREIERQQGTARRGQEFFPLLIILLAMMFALETAMANRFYTRT